MIEDLLSLSKNLLRALEIFDFTNEEETYIIGVVIKIIFILLVELGKKNKDLWDPYKMFNIVKFREPFHVPIGANVANCTQIYIILKWRNGYFST